MKELESIGLRFSPEQMVAVVYKDLILDTELRVDLLVENCIVIELKSVK
jgi:GxxExxY protein